MENRRSMRSETSSASAPTAPTHTTGVSSAAGLRERSSGMPSIWSANSQVSTKPAGMPHKMPRML